MSIEEASILEESKQVPTPEELNDRRFTIAELAQYSPEELEDWPIESLEVLEEKMVRRLNMVGHEFQTTAALQEKFRQPRQSDAQYRKQLLGHIVFGALPELARAVKRQTEQQQQHVVERHQELSRRRLQVRADEWKASATVKNEMNTTQSTQVEEMHRRQNTDSPAAYELYEYTKKTEPVVADWMSLLKTLGTGVEFSPSAERDDFRNGVDFYAYIPVKEDDGSERRIALGIDYTLTSDDDLLRKKLWRNFQQPSRQVLHATIGDPSHHRPAVAKEERFTPLILALDKSRVDSMTEDLNLIEAHDATDQSTVDKLLKEYETDPVLQYLLPLSLHEQLITQLEQLEKIGPSFEGDRQILTQAMLDHRALIQHFEYILDQRKNLRDEAEGMVSDPGMRRMSRVGDRNWHHAFIRYYPPSIGGMSAWQL